VTQHNEIGTATLLLYLVSNALSQKLVILITYPSLLKIKILKISFSLSLSDCQLSFFGQYPLAKAKMQINQNKNLL